jgi:hypothetical protein
MKMYCLKMPFTNNIKTNVKEADVLDEKSLGADTSFFRQFLIFVVKETAPERANR